MFLLRVKKPTLSNYQYSVRGVNAHAQISCHFTDYDDCDRLQQQVAEIVEVPDQSDVPIYAADLAKRNPGCEVEVYDLTGVVQCPVGDVVTKKISKNGVLPE